MGISKILGSISPAFGAVTGKGVFGDIQKAMGPAAGLVFQAGKAYRDDKKRKATAAEIAAMQKAEFDAKRAAASGMRARPMMEEVMVAEGTPTMRKGGKLPDLTGDGKVTRADVLKGRGVPGFKKGSNVSAAEAVHKHERAKHKGQPLTKMAKGGSTASKRGDGCCSKGKTKGRMV
jgi:hypothetical protein